MFLRKLMNKSTEAYLDKLSRLKAVLNDADAVIIGAGSGLSAAAGFTYSGERFERYFHEYWAWWSRHIWVNRYMSAPKTVYHDLLTLVQDKDYFVLTTNVDHCFQKAGFDKHRMFYTQGDYGLLQCSVPCHNDTYNNENIVRRMVKSQGFAITEGNDLIIQEGQLLKMEIPSELIPHCSKCGKPMTVNLRSDSTFVEDKGWDAAHNRYEDFIRRHKNLHILFLELGVGANTPIIIKYPFWRMTAENSKAVYACINYGAALCPQEIEKQSICLDADIGKVLKEIM